MQVIEPVVSSVTLSCG